MMPKNVRKEAQMVRKLEKHVWSKRRYVFLFHFQNEHISLEMKIIFKIFLMFFKNYILNPFCRSIGRNTELLEIYEGYIIQEE